MGHHLFHRGSCFAKDLYVFLQIPDPLLRGSQLASISITYAADEVLIDALLALPPVQA